jgi:hypothetical protein
MQIGSRFTEYGLTGGFFWICQLFFLTYSGQAKTLLSYLSTVQLQYIPDRIWQIGSPAISALAIIAVFVAGLLLDLLAVFFRRFEMIVFREHLGCNRDWLGRLIADHKSYCEADYEEFDRLYRETPVAKAGFLSRFRFWNREQRQRNAADAKLGSKKMIGSYERLWSFFTSYVLVESGSSQLSLMVDQYYLWRTGRAVSSSLMIVFFEIPLLLPWFEHGKLSLLQSQLRLVLLFVLTFTSVMVTKALYSRLCFTLFALVYVTQDKRSMELEKTA